MQNAWKSQGRNSHTFCTAGLEIVGTIPTNALILRKESTASTMPLPPCSFVGREKKEKTESVEETRKTDMFYECETGKRLEIRIGSRDFVPDRECEESLEIPGLVSWFWSGEEKKHLRRMRQGIQDLLRPQEAAGSRSIVRRRTRLSGSGSTPRRLPAVRQGETRETRLAGGQSLLHETIWILCRAPMPLLEHQGCGQRTAPGLAHGQGSGKAVYGRAVKASRQAGSQDHWR